MRLEYFQMVDRVVELDLTARTIRMEAHVPMESPVFEGHFPGYPLMPGVLLCEAMAQTSGWLIIGATNFTRMPFLAAFKEAKLRNFVPPGKLLDITASMVHEGSGFAMTKAEIRVEGKLTANAEITFRVVEFPNPVFRESMEKVAALIQFPMKALSNG